jgi:hypothetical protein
MLAKLREPATRSVVQDADIVVWNIGINDFSLARNAFRQPGACGGPDNQDCLRSTVIAFQDNWDAILAEFAAGPARPGRALRTMDIYYPFVAFDSADGTFGVLAGYLRQMNDHIRSTVAIAPLAAVAVRFNGLDGTQDPHVDLGYLYDFVHPNTVGATVIANALMELEPLTALALDSDGDGCWDRVEQHNASTGGVPADALNPNDFPDVNGDGQIAFTDFMTLLPAWNSAAGSPSFNPDVDFNENQRIDLADVLIFAGSWGRTCE